MIDQEATKYTHVEYERRFLILADSDWRNLVERYSKVLEDKYLDNTRLRLRRLTDTDTGHRLIKLTKKFASESPYYRTISRILLSPSEYQIFDSLPGARINKIRYYHKYLDRVFSIDVFEGELTGLMLAETEADGLTELMLAEPPRYVKAEVTEDNFFNGGNLCRITRLELQHKLATYQ